MIQVRENPSIKREDLLSLYKSVKWDNYTKDPDSLVRAIEQSLYIAAAYDKNQLIGLIRVVGDDESIAYIQDILINPTYQNQGVGTMLFNHVKDRFSHVRQMVLITDHDEKNQAFYHKQGFVKGENYALEMFVILK